MQGVMNIVRFNWPFYVLASGLLICTVALALFTRDLAQILVVIGGAGILLPIAVSLLVSLYVYDLSGLYDLDWLGEIKLKADGHFANINAGFDETTLLLRQRYRQADIAVYDFYDPQRHTEASIRRARTAYPSLPETAAISTAHIPAADQSMDAVFLIFAAHEVRDDAERTRFMQECRRIVRPDGHVIVTEHLRDAANFAAYTIGFFHFFPLRSWLEVFRGAGLRVERQFLINPFVTTFILIPDGDTL